MEAVILKAIVMSGALKKELDSLHEELAKLRKTNQELVAENEQLSEQNEQYSEQNRELSEQNKQLSGGNRLANDQIESLQAELSQNQMFSQQEIEQLSRQLEILQKDAELERFRAVEEERKKWELRENKLSRQLDIALEKLERAEAQIENLRQCGETQSILLQSQDEVPEYPVVLSSGSELQMGTSLQESLSEQPPMLISISASQSTVPSMVSGPSSLRSMADQAMSLSAQPHTVVSPLSVTLPQLPPFSLTTLTTQNEQLMPNRQLYSLLTEPSVSWTGQRPHISVGARHSKKHLVS